MKDKSIIETLKEPERLISNEYYFKYIFKKTEKIICAVFYILSNIKENESKSVLALDLERWALDTLTFAGETLRLEKNAASRRARNLIHRLVMLESKLRTLHAANLLEEEHLQVFIAEIDTLIRSTRSMEGGGVMYSAVSIPRRGEQVARQSQSTARHLSVQRSGKDRRAQIRTVLEAGGEVSIKDISDTIKDCSEKTIQRELNDMIKDGIVIRKGEKRWSKYRLNV